MVVRRVYAMSKARGVVQTFEAAQVAGIDTRVWQDKGSSTDNRGVYFTLSGEVTSAGGIKPLVYKWLPGVGKVTTPFSSAAPTALGVYSRDGVTDLLVEYDGKIGIVQNNTIVDLVDDRHIPADLSESTRFIQVANVLLILNGKDPNLKWDGEKITPLGVVAAPNAPTIVESEAGDGDIGVRQIALRFWGGYSITKTDNDYSYTYKVSWVNEFGQESELSEKSNSVSDENVLSGSHGQYRYLILLTGLEGAPPQDDIIGRNVYRSVDQITYFLLRYLPGTDGETMIDTIDPAAPLQEEAPAASANLPPPISSWAFFYRGRTYYGGNPESPTVLFYSAKSGGKEAVKPTDAIIVGNNISEPITGFALAGDFALLFKDRSTYMLTQDKAGEPILTPLSTSVGAISDKAAVGFEGKVFFIAYSGLYGFDGSKIMPISEDVAEVIKRVPRATLRNSFGWVDPECRRVYFSIATGPADHNNEVWALHVDNGALSKIGAAISSAAYYKGQTVVGYNSSTANDGTFDLGVWGAGTKIYYRPTPVSGILSSDIDRNFETRWIFGKNPQADKTFYRVDVFYVQTGGYQVGDASLGTESFDNRIYVEWYTDWNRNVVGGTTLTPADPDALLWDEANDDGSGTLTWDQAYSYDSGLRKLWDEKRVRCQRVNIAVSERVNPASPVSLITPTTDPSGENLTAKSLKLSFSTGGSAGWRIVGFLLHVEDHGVRAEGTDHE
jgi:hypothetical protein